MMRCEFCMRRIGKLNQILNSIRGVPEGFCYESHYLFHQQKERSDNIIREIKELLGNKVAKTAAPVVKIKKSPLLRQKRKCPPCAKVFLSKRVNQKCCSRSCARKYFYSLNQIKYICTKKLDIGQQELSMNNNKNIN